MEKIKTIIKPPDNVTLNFRELWQYRELLYFFTWRDIKVRYKQTFFGIAWAVLQPLGMMVLFVVVFSGTAISKGYADMPYALFVLSGLITWNLFYTSVSHASDSMISNSNIIRKIYFPRLIVPVSAICAALVDFLFAFIVFLCFCVFYRQPVEWTALFYFPAAIFLSMLTAFGLGSFLGALNVKYRDFRYALPFLLQFLFFATQIIYPASIIQQTWLKYILSLNPMNAVTELIRSPLTAHTLDYEIVWIGCAVTFLLAIVGLVYFKKTEAYFADIV